MAKAAAETALLNKQLDSLSRDSVRTRRSLSDIDRQAASTGAGMRNAGNDIDRLSGRMRILADVAAVLGPALVPVGAVAVPAISGLASQLGFAATAGATAVLAFQGVGDALSSLNKAALEPTDANLESARVAMEKLTPAARDFVLRLRDMLPEFQKLQAAAAQGFFPGARDGLIALEDALPRVQDVISAIAGELGSIAADTGESLASDRWSPFLDFLAEEAPSALADMAAAAGSTAHALATLWMATDPLNDDFSAWLVEATDDLDQWAAGLAETQGFVDFIDYVERTGPKVAKTFGAIGDAALQILEAVAPLGGPVLDGIRAMADLIGSIADSDLGTPIFGAIAGLSLLNRTLALTGREAVTLRSLPSAFGKLDQSISRTAKTARTLRTDVGIMGSTFMTAGSRSQRQTERLNGALTRTKNALAPVGKAAAGVAAIGIAASGAADGIGLTNTASLGLMGTLLGPYGAALGITTGLTLDLIHANDDTEASMRALQLAARQGDFSTYRSKLQDLKGDLEDIKNITGKGDFFADLGRTLADPKFVLFGGKPRAQADIEKSIDAAKVEAAARRVKAAAGLMKDGFEGTADGIDRAAQSTDDFMRELEKLNRVLSGRASFRDYEQAIDDFADRAQKRAEILGEVADAQADLRNAREGSARDIAAAQRDLEQADTKEERQAARDRLADLKRNAAEQEKAGRERIASLKGQAAELENTLDVSTQAGRDTQDALDNIAQTALGVAKTLSGPARVEFLAAARRDFIKAATDAGMARDAARKLADEVLGLNSVKGKPKIVIDPNGAFRVIDEVQERLKRMRGRRLKITIDNEVGNVGKAELLLATGSGGFAGGGYTGNAPVDRPAGVVHGREFVFDAEATRRAGVENLYALQQSLRGYAGGGYVTPVGPSIDYDRLTAAMLSARPLYGPVTASVDLDSWERREAAAARMGTLDGYGVRRG
ncbi:MAG TPA: hypothetical protein VFO98_15530 [Marmoricola sp.]|nr:hypothetical protein [Marmoricola sp.]